MLSLPQSRNELQPWERYGGLGTGAPNQPGPKLPKIVQLHISTSNCHTTEERELLGVVRGLQGKARRNGLNKGHRGQEERQGVSAGTADVWVRQLTLRPPASWAQNKSGRRRPPSGSLEAPPAYSSP